MKRPPIIYAYEEKIVWNAVKLLGSEGIAHIKIFARDPENNATAALLRYGAGFKLPKATSKVYSDAIFLSGKMRMGDRMCHKGTYYYRPSGVEYGPMVAEEETIKFVITGGRGDRCSKDSVFVSDVESEEIPWKIDDVQNLEGRMFKRLRTDRDAGCQVIYQVTSRPTVNIPNEVGGHPDVEEVYVLEGEFTDYYEENEAWLISGAGTYVYRPPLSRHGQSVLARIPAKFFVKFYHPDLFERRNPVKGIPPASFEE